MNNTRTQKQTQQILKFTLWAEAQPLTPASTSKLGSGLCCCYCAEELLYGQSREWVRMVTHVERAMARNCPAPWDRHIPLTLTIARSWFRRRTWFHWCLTVQSASHSKSPFNGAIRSPFNVEFTAQQPTNLSRVASDSWHTSILPNNTFGSHVNCTLVEKRCPREIVEVAESSPATLKIRQKSNPSSFSNRKRPLDPSRKNSQGPLPANLGFFETSSSNLHFSTIKSPLGALRSFRG